MAVHRHLHRHPGVPAVVWLAGLQGAAPVHPALDLRLLRQQPAAVRRVVAKVGKENTWTLMNIRECDRVGMKKKEAPYRLRKYHAMIEEVLRDPISVGQLVVDGNILMNELHMKPGPRMGWMLHALLEEVLDDPKKNTREYLDKRVGELEKLSDEDLKTLGEEAKKAKEDIEDRKSVV